jgi:hypothetical protein
MKSTSNWNRGINNLLNKLEMGTPIIFIIAIFSTVKRMKAMLAMRLLFTFVIYFLQAYVCFNK